LGDGFTAHPPPPLTGPGPPVALDDVVLHARLGAGATGAVYRGAWRGAPVAVKITRVPLVDGAALDAAVREVVIGRRVAHPHVVATYAWSVAAVAPAAARAASAAGRRRPDLAAARAALARTSDAGGVAAALCRAGGAGAPPPSPPPRPASAASFASDEGFGSPHAPRPVSGAPLLAALRAGALGCAGAAEGAPASPSAHAPPLTDVLVVAVLELCELGTLQTAALDKSAFHPGGRHGPRAAYRALLRTAGEVARGLDALHAHGVVHGDVSPSNVLLSRQRADRRGYVAKLADFGAARALPAGGGPAAVGTAIGAPAFAAPEKVGAGVAGPPSDVYALGVLLHQMATGRPPYAGLHDAQVAVGVAAGSLRPAWPVGVPEPLVALAASCWAHDPAARPTAAAVAAALADVEADFRRGRG
jgi:serine/threonine protein kinase